MSINGTSWPDPFSLKKYLSFILSKKTSWGRVRIEDFQQGRFPCPIFPDQANHFPSIDLKIDLIQGHHPWKSFGNLDHLKEGGSTFPPLLGTVTFVHQSYQT